MSKVKVEMKKEIIRGLFNVLVAIATETVSRKFAYAASLNYDELEKYKDAIDDEEKNINGWEDYNKKRKDTIENHSEKDESGKPKIETVGKSTQYMIEDKSAFNDDIKALEEEYKEVLDEQKKMLKEKEEVELHMVEMNHVPELVSISVMKYIKCFVIDDKKENSVKCSKCGNDEIIK